MLAGYVSSFKPQEKHTQKNMLIHTRILGGSGFWSIYIAIVVVLGRVENKQTTLHPNIAPRRNIWRPYTHSMKTPKASLPHRQRAVQGRPDNLQVPPSVLHLLDSKASNPCCLVSTAKQHIPTFCALKRPVSSGKCAGKA